MTTERITWRETRRRLADDRRRLRAHLRARGEPSPAFPLLRASYLCAWLHRLAHYADARGLRRSARLLWHLAMVVTGADIAPSADLGGGLLVVSPAGVAISGRAGRNLTMMPLSGVGGELSLEDIGAGPGLPVLGDDVTLGTLTGVLGPVRVGDGVRVMPGCVVIEDVPAGAVVASPKTRALVWNHP